MVLKYMIYDIGNTIWVDQTYYALRIFALQIAGASLVAAHGVSDALTTCCFEASDPGTLLWLVSDLPLEFRAVIRHVRLTTVYGDSDTGDLTEVIYFCENLKTVVFDNNSRTERDNLSSTLMTISNAPSDIVRNHPRSINLKVHPTPDLAFATNLQERLTMTLPLPLMDFY